MKTCTRCGVEKPVDAFGPQARGKDGLRSWCRDCCKEDARIRYREGGGKERLAAAYRADPEAAKAKSRAYYRANRERAIAKMRAIGQALKAAAIAHYGGACACCQESVLAFLTIDHPDGGGREHRKTTGGGTSFYRWLKNHDYPEGFVVLCFNCNCGRAVNGGTCPHLEAAS